MRRRSLTGIARSRASGSDAEPPPLDPDYDNPDTPRGLSEAYLAAVLPDWLPATRGAPIRSGKVVTGSSITQQRTSLMTDTPKPLTDEAIEAALKTVASRGEIVDPTIPGLRLRATKTGGTWSLLSRSLGGGRQRIGLGSWPAVSAEAAQAQAMAIHRRLDGPDDTPQTIDELIDEYELFKGSSLKRAEGTMRSIRDILDPFRPRHPAGLTPRELATAFRTKSLTAPSHANRQLAYVKAMFNWARKQGMVDTNPAENLPKLVKEVPRDRTPTLEEVVKIWRAAECRPAPFSQIVRLIILTGCRRDEVANMHASELDIKDGELGEVWTIPGTRTKNGLPLRVPLSTQARQVIEEVLMPGSEWVFTARTTLPFNGWSKAKEGLDRYMVLSGDGIPHWRIHDLRRSFATYACEELDCAKEVVDKCLNHVATATSSTVSRVYIRSELFKQRKEALERWADVVCEAVEAARPVIARAAVQADLEKLMLPPRVDLAHRTRLTDEEQARRSQLREEASLDPGPKETERQDLPDAARPPTNTPYRNIQPRWLKHGGWLEQAQPDGPRPFERASYFLQKMRRQEWWRAIAQWAEGKDLPCFRKGEILYLRLTNAQTREFLLLMGRLGVEDAHDQAEYLVFQEYFVCAWFCGEPDESNGFNNTDRYYRYAMNTLAVSPKN